MAEEKKMSMGDSIFDKLGDWITKTIQFFAASVFVLFGLGALFGALVVGKDPALLAAPFILAVLAYYSRNFALIFFVLVLVGIWFVAGI